MRIAVLDLGSTSFHASVVDVDESGELNRVLRHRETLHLGSRVAKHGYLSEDDCQRAIRAARLLRRSVDSAEPQMVIAAATSALRDAVNGGGLIDRLEVAARCKVRTLSGSEEARLAYAAARRAAPLGDGPLLVCDLGGGSLEMAIGTGDEVHLSASFPLGASRLHALLVSGDPLAADERTSITDHVRSSVRDFAADVRLGPVAGVATGGTARAVSRLHLARRGLRPGTSRSVVVPAGDLNGIAATLARLPLDERTALPGAKARRMDVLPVGALILAALVEQMDLGALTVVEWGLREGLVLEAAGLLPAVAVGAA